MTSSASQSDEIQKCRALMRNRKYPEAIQLLQKLQEVDATDEDVLDLLAMAHYYNKDFPAARSAYEQLTRHHPMNTKGWVNLGAVLNRLGEYRKAVEALRRAVQRDRKCAEGYYNMGIAQRGMNLQTMAISAYKEAIKLKPDMVDAHINLGNIYAEMKNLGLAQKCFQEALRHDPASKKAQSALEKTQSNQKSAKKESSPFGRLVNLEELERQAVTLTARQLDAATRTGERTLVQEVTRSVRTAAKELLPVLQEPLHAQLHRLQRIVLQTENRLSSSEHADYFSQTLSDLMRLRGVIQSGIQEIRDHLSSTSLASKTE